MSDSLIIEREKPIDYMKCYRKARDGYDSLYMEICELYLLSRAVLEFSEEVFDSSVCYELIYQRCIALFADADAFLASFAENFAEK